MTTRQFNLKNRIIITLLGSSALAMLAVVVAVSAILGYMKSFTISEFSQALYPAIQVFTGDGNSVEATNIALNIAYLTAPILIVGTTIGAISVLFLNQIESARLLITRNHVVICGLGQKGLLLAREYRKIKKRVVVIDLDHDGSKSELCKKLGILLLCGDATDRDTLSAANIADADSMTVVCGSDSVNADVAFAAREIVNERLKRKFRCTIHITDPQFCNLLRNSRMITSSEKAFYPIIFNPFELGAQLMLSNVREEANLLIVGLDEMGASVLIQAARSSWVRHRGRSCLNVTVADSAAVKKVEALAVEFPHLHDACRIKYLSLDINDATFKQGKFLWTGEASQPRFTDILVCQKNEGEGISIALTLDSLLGSYDIPIVLSIQRQAGLAKFLQIEGSRIQPIGFLDRTCMPDSFEIRANESIARAIHEYYLDWSQSLNPMPSSELTTTWTNLPESVRDSNRHHAIRIRQHLAAIGYDIEVTSTWNPQEKILTPEEINKVARLEHSSWCKEMFDSGWKFGQVTDRERRIHADLVDWEDLSSQEKEKNLQMINTLPEKLAIAGLAIRSSA